MEGIDRQLQQLTRSIGAISADLHRHRSSLASLQGNLDTVQRALRQQIADVAAGQQALTQRVGQLRGEFTAFAERSQTDMQQIIAHTRLLDVRAQIDRKFGQYEDVRRNVQGVLLALDSGLALHATMQLIAETKSINAPRYWLASVLNAVAAWFRPDRAATERALAHALTCDIGKTALFAGLLNARYGRFDATDRWFQVYLREQDPRRMSQEFLVVLDSAMLGVLGRNTCERIADKCQTWYEHLVVQPAAIAEQVRRWEAAIEQRSAGGHPLDEFRTQFPILAKVTADSIWQPAARAFHETTAFEGMQVALRRQVEVASENDGGWRERIDRILHGLAQVPEPDEQQLRLQEIDLERIINHGGDRESAARAQEFEAPLAEPRVDLLSMVTNVAQHPHRFDVSGRTTQLVTQLASQWIASAVTNVRDRNAARLPEKMPIVIEGWSAEIGLGTTPESLADDLKASMDRLTDEEELRERRTGLRYGTAGLSLALGALCVFAVLRGAPFFSVVPVLLLVLALVSGLVGLVVHLGTPHRIQVAQEKGEQRRSRALQTLYRAAAEQQRLLTEWNVRLTKADELRDLVDRLEPPELPAGDPEPGLDDRADGRSLGRGGDQAAREPTQSPLNLPGWNLAPAEW